MGELEYFKLKCKMLEITNQEIQLNQALEKLQIRKRNLLAENKLDPNRNYNMIDKNFEIVEATEKQEK